MSYKDIHVGDYGWTARLQLTEDGSPFDISSFTTKEMIFYKPDGTQLVKGASFVTDGTDGMLQYNVESGVIDASGRWGIRARIAKSGVDLRSHIVWFYVEE